MAGIFDRLTGANKVPVHLITAVVVLSADGELTNVQLRNAMNSQLDSGNPLTAAEETDLVAIKTALIAAGDPTKFIHKIESGLLLAAIGHFAEVDLRAYINIT